MKRGKLLGLWTGVCLCCGALGLAGKSFAEPRISGLSGQFVHGGSITIEGESFGTKAAAPPFRYDDFEAGAVGQDLAGWDFPEQYINPRYSGQVVRRGSNRSAQAYFPASYLFEGQNVRVNACNFGIDGTYLPRIYIDVWYYYDADHPYSRNHKLFRVHSDSFNPNLYYNVYCGGGGGVLLQDIPNLTLTDMTAGKVITSQGSTYFANKWTHIQGWFEESSPGLFNGTAQLWLDGVKVADRVRNFWNHEPGDASRWNRLWFGNYLAHDAGAGCGEFGDAWTFWDNVYVDTTRAHVEVCESPTWNGRGHCETQIPESWGPTSINVRANLAAFVGSDLYAYVVDENGLVNLNGYPLCPDCPSPPQGLRLGR